MGTTSTAPPPPPPQYQPPPTPGTHGPPPGYPAQPAGAGGGLISRMMRAMRLDASLYEEVERDKSAMSQAVTVVVISSICAGLGSLIGSLFRGGLGLGLLGVIITPIVALVGWLIWSFITYIVGTKIFKGPETRADYSELLRTIGFSSSPGVFNILNFIPLVSLVVGIWQLAAMVIAVRQALDFTTVKAILTCIVGWIVNVLITMLVGGLIALPFIL